MNDFESLAQKAYARFGELAKRYYYKFKRPVVTDGGTPCMLFLGNHSSGKSSMVNWLLGGGVQVVARNAAFPCVVQKVGEAVVVDRLVDRADRRRRRQTLLVLLVFSFFFSASLFFVLF